MADLQKKLTRSKNDRMIAGVCGGIGEYLNIDTTIVRILFVLIGLTWGSGLFAYIILALIVPEKE